MKLIKALIITIFTTLILTACNKSHEDNAEQVAVAFFDALYNQKDIKRASSFCTPDFAKELTKYRTANNAAKRLFNMSFDSTKIDAAMADFKVREEFNTSGNLTILFTGDRHGKTYKELKRVKLIKQGENWLVAQLLKDPMPS